MLKLPTIHNLILTSLLLFFATTAVTGMEKSHDPLAIEIHNKAKKLFVEIKTLPSDLQQYIMLYHSAIIFLGQQPITLGKPQGHTDEIYSVAISSNDEVVTAGWDNMVKIWDLGTGSFLHEFARDTYAKYSPNDEDNENNDYIKYLVPRYSNLSVTEGSIIYALNTGELLRKVRLNNNDITWKPSMVIMDRKSIVSYNNKVIIVDLDTEERLFSLTGPDGHTNEISSIDMDDTIIITGSWDCTAKLWDAHTGAFLRTLANTRIGCINAVAIYENLAITGGNNHIANIWNIQNGTCLRTLAGPNGHTNKIRCVTLDDNYAVTGSEDYTAKIWPLLPNLKGSPEDNPLLWIIHHADLLQFDFIQRAYEKTITYKKFIIALPKKLGVIENDESQKQRDGRIYFTLPSAIRAYLRTRLNIKK